MQQLSLNPKNPRHPQHLTPPLPPHKKELESFFRSLVYVWMTCQQAFNLILNLFLGEKDFT